MKKYLFMLLALCLMPANNTAQILNSLKDIIRPTDPSLIRTLNGQWDFYFINGADWKEQACFYQPDYDISSWDRILVPGCWDALGYVEPKYANPEEMQKIKTSRTCSTRLIVNSFARIILISSIVRNSGSVSSSLKR